MPKAARSPKSSAASSKSPRSTKKKPVSSRFISDEAEEDDDGGLIVKRAATEEGDAEEEEPEPDDKYEADFINDGDPYDDASDNDDGLSPPPPGQKSARAKVDKSKRKTDSKAAADKSADVIDMASSSEEDLEAMDQDDSMFPKLSNVKPSALPPSLRTRSAVKRSADSSQEPLSVPVPSKKVKLEKPSGNAPPANMTPEMAEAFGDFMAQYSKKKTSKPHESDNDSLDVSPIKRVDFDELELQKGLLASAGQTQPKTKKTIRSPSPDWEPPFAGEIPTTTVADKSGKGKGKASRPNAAKNVDPAAKPSSSRANVASGSGSAKKPRTGAKPNSILAKFGDGKLSQYFQGSDDEQEVEESSDEDTGPGDTAQTVFLEDLETYKAHYNPEGPCGVTDVDLQDPILLETYNGLPPLPAGRQLVPVYDPSMIGVEYSPSSVVKGGRVKFSIWAKHIKKMLASNSIGAVVFERAEPKFINPSRVSPIVLSRQVIPGSSATQRLHVDGRVAVCVSALFCTESKLVSPSRIGGKSERMRKWVSGIFHNQEWERFESLVCFVFGEQVLRAQLSSKKALSFQTMISPDNGGTEQTNDSLFDRSAPADMFSPIVSTSSPASKSRATPSKYIPSHAKTLLAYNDFVPVYDARKRVVDFNVDLDRLDKKLPLFPGEVPFGAFIVVGYTCSSYMGSISGSNERVPHLGCNILWVVVCGVPPLGR
ncbi:hypothetical protein DFH06DRAFT_1324999 [Mycena polygramma]|nr:hypothetical protein DFH06DRAFT_1324999 [Mycena polygramma]